MCEKMGGETFANFVRICSKISVKPNTFVCFLVVSETEKRRLQDAFRRSSAANSIISKQVNLGEYC